MSPATPWGLLPEDDPVGGAATRKAADPDAVGCEAVSYPAAAPTASGVLTPPANIVGTIYQLRDRVEDTTTGMVGTITVVSHLLGRRLLTVRWDESTLGEEDAETDLRPFDDDAEERRLSERASEVLAHLNL